MGAQTQGLLYRSLVGAAGLGQVPRKEEEATGAPVEEATGTEEAEVAEALLSEPPPPQGMKAAKWSGMPVDNRPPFISSCNPLVSELMSCPLQGLGFGRSRGADKLRHSTRRCACILLQHSSFDTAAALLVPRMKPYLATFRLIVALASLGGRRLDGIRTLQWPIFVVPRRRAIGGNFRFAVYLTTAPPLPPSPPSASPSPPPPTPPPSFDTMTQIPRELEQS
jgi:hypothetical protein